MLVWCLYFALGFRAFARGQQANGLGMVLTVGLPLATIVLSHIGWTTVCEGVDESFRTWIDCG